ncbi:MAG: aminoglycoside phosphotransferase family protein [Firmicutes bacterium]|nr:aminoglycoside phosphotransferase family protein [Bacillota bacterium]
MERAYFTIEDDFDAIIRENLANVVEVQKIPTGWTNYVFIATTGADTRYIFRFPRNDFWVDCLSKEVAFNRFVRGKVKVVTARQTIHRDKGRIFSKHRMIPGVVLQEAYPTMTDRQKQRLAVDLADYIADVQSINLDGVESQMASDFLCRLAESTDNGDYDFSKMDRLRQMEAVRCPCHGDLNPGNIILDKRGRLKAVLDYAFVAYSSDIHDLARIIGRLPSDFYRPMVDEFEARTGKKVDRDDLGYLVELWRYVEIDYIKYMARCHKDVELPKF